MGSLTNEIENEILDHLFNNGSWTSPASTFLALFTDDPGETGSVANEVGADLGYDRMEITFGAPSNRAVAQSALIQYGTASSAWGTVGHWGVCSGGTIGGANILAYGAFAVAKVVFNTNTPTVSQTDPVTISFSSAACANVTTWCAERILDLIFNDSSNVPWTPPTTYWAGFATTNIGVHDEAIGDINEVSSASPSSYARASMSSWTTASGGSLTNEDVITFNIPGGSWGTVSACFLANSQTGSTILFFDNNVLDRPDDGDDVSFPANQLKVKLG